MTVPPHDHPAYDADCFRCWVGREGPAGREFSESLGIPLTQAYEFGWRDAEAAVACDVDDCDEPVEGIISTAEIPGVGRVVFGLCAIHRDAMLRSPM